MIASCQATGSKFEIDDGELSLLASLSPTIGETTYQLPIPAYCPTERARQRLSYRNLSSLYKRKCDLTGRSLISPYHPDSPHKVYYSEDWWSDAWDGKSYGRDFDFNRPFFDQFLELYRDVPLIHHYVVQSENCEYINGAANCRDCYLSFDMDYCEQCYYVHNAKYGISSLDCLGLVRSELCYECVDCDGCYSLVDSTRCVNCSESYFLSQCRNCQNCFGCSNLSNKQYYIFNKKSSKEEFEQLKQQISSASAYQALRERAEKHHLQYPKKYYFGHSNEDFSGDNIQHIKNSYHCFDSFELENCYHCHYVFQSANSMDFSIFGDNSQWIYNCQATGLNCSNDVCCNFCWSGSSNNLYSHLVNACSNCFGCSGLKQQSYCILNKQYTAAEYGKLADRIIQHMINTGEWGKFFPPECSPFGFNETVAYEYFPLSREQAESRGYRWRDKNPPPMSQNPAEVADSIDSVSDDICKQELKCETTGRAYKIIPQELALLRSLKLPIPRNCPEQRHELRKLRKNPRQLWQRNCAKTAEALWTSYPPDSDAVVCSEKAYLEEVD